jgi:predicted ribosome quality control (RQC) complex YloA/Tae2 family protein
MDVFIIETTKSKQDSKTQIQLEKLHRQLNQQQQAVHDLEEKMAKQKHHGEILYLHFQQVDRLLKEVQMRLNDKDKTNLLKLLTDEPTVDSFDLATQTIKLCLKDTQGTSECIILDMRKSISENAEQAYDESKKFKHKQEGARKAILHTEGHMDSVQKQLLKEHNIRQEKKTEIVKTFWFEKYRWFISSDGNLVIGGKDTKTNDQIVKKHLESGDRYAHADIHGAPSCIIKHKTYDDAPLDISKQAVTEACIFAASYSKAWKQYTEAQAYWVLPEQVSKTPQSGEFVPKGAFIIRGQRNYCKCKLELAIGLLRIDGVDKIIGGPAQAVEKWCKQYVILRPDATNKQHLTKKLSQLFKTSVDEINKVLPPGDSTIVSTNGFTS